MPGRGVTEPPATTRQLVEAARAFAAMLPPKVSDEERAGALRALEDSLALLAEQCEELPTLGQIREAVERSFESGS